jgi:hypothetical protein
MFADGAEYWADIAVLVHWLGMASSSPGSRGVTGDLSLRVYLIAQQRLWHPC